MMLYICLAFVIIAPFLFFIGGYLLGRDSAFKEANLIVDGMERAQKHQLDFIAKTLQGKVNND